MLKQWLDAGKCLIGAHQGDWAFEAHGNCLMVQTCRVCGHVSRRVEHLWSAWSPAAEAACDWVRSCTRCTESETREEHAWSGWKYRAPGSCEQGRQCDRCSKWGEETQIAHVWAAWEYSERHRGPVRDCARCALRQSAFTGEIGPADEAPEASTAGPVSAGSFKSQVEEILQTTSVEIAEGRVDGEILGRAVARMKALTIETEDDRHAFLSGYLRLMDMVLPAVPKEVAASLTGQRQLMQEVFDGMYGRPDSAYLTTNRIVQQLSRGLTGGGDRDELVAKARADLDEVRFDGSDADFQLQFWGRMRISALDVAHTLSEMAASADESLVGIDSLAREVQNDATFKMRPFVDAALATLERADDRANNTNAVVTTVLPIVGMGLLMNPSASPAFEPVRDRLVAIMARASGVTDSSGSSSAQSPAAAEEPRPLPARYAAILADYSAVLEREGFSEYAFQQTLNAMKELPADSAEHPVAVHEALLRFVDLSVPHAPADAAQMLEVLRENCLEQMKFIEDGGEELTSAEAVRRGDEIVQTLKAALEAGDPVGPAFMRAQTAFQALAMRIRSDDDETGKILMTRMIQLPQMIVPYMPEGMRQQADYVFGELTPAMDTMMSGMDVPSDDHVERAVFQREVRDQLNRFGAASMKPTADALPTTPHVRQFLELFPALSQRILNPAMRELAEKEQEEAERLRKRIESPMGLLRYARTEDEFIQPQRQGFRRTILEFRRFERRRHLMLSYPAFPTDDVPIDANCVFFSGSERVASIVKDACSTIGMSLPLQPGLTNPIHARWQQFRSAAVAVFDYSDYDVSRADPSERPDRQPDAEASILGAAGPVASVAYETAWAYVLGTPMVVVGRAGRSVPFDVDVEPVLLGEDGQDAERVTAAIQASFYGVPHGISGTSVADTIEHVRQRYGEAPDPEMRTLVAALSDRDAVRARLILETIVERIDGQRPLVTIPTFPGRYPAASGHLFHVTAFRDWTAVAQEETRAACKRAGVEYRIGSDRIRPDILREVWDDLCSASLVVADITNLNPNAVLELAIAHALGRPTLILTQNTQPHRYFPAIAKVRTHRYDPDRGRQVLASMLDNFIAGRD